MQVDNENNKCFLYSTCNHIDCDKFCVKQYKLNYLYDEALITDTQRKHIDLRIDEDGTDEQEFETLFNISQNIKEFVNTGKNLYLFSSNAGNGKTSWSLRLAQSYIEKIWSKCSLSCHVLFISVPRLLLALKDNIDTKSEYINHIKENITNCDLVIWDDIGTKQSTTFENENLLYMIDTRINNNKANIFTSNLNRNELHISLGDRLYSRIYNNSINIELKGKDKRFLNK